MDITPSPRILRMLGEIEFDEWQCVAELADNAFDDFSEILDAGQSWPGGFKVSVTLPGPGAGLSGAEVVVRDTGRGMTRETLEQAVKAGWSSNERFDKLGLFGMGFNVSTARLGRLTRVLTTRQGDPEWVGVEIDLDALGADFEAPDITEPKDDPSDHGTKIIVSNLHRDRAEWLQRNAENLRTTLGRVYGWLLDNRPFELWVQGNKVKPRRACRWGDDRYVIYGSGASAEKIPAYIEIDQKFQPADACELCGNWQNLGKDACDQCGSNQLRQRERRLSGWLGVQRHLDRRDFGIDFLRNGRKILQYDKSLFNWRNPNDPTGSVDIEYPVELANQGGRLIGEIHLDYVPVHYDKTAFEYSDRAWRAAVDYLRGEAPLQPQKAKAAGYPENTSPLARLFKGYRRNAAGVRCLIPGDGSRPLHEETRQWARRFWSGDPDYQTDQKWWDQVEAHERRLTEAKLAKATGGTKDDPDEEAVLAALGVDASTTAEPEEDTAEPTSGPTPTPAASKFETVLERLVRYIEHGVVVPELTREFGLPELGQIKVEARALTEHLLDADDLPTPVWLAQGAGGTATGLIDVTHAAFTKLGLEPAELLLAEVTAALKVKADSPLSHSQITTRLRATCLPDTAVDPAVIRAQATELLTDIRQRMADNVASDPQRALGFLDPDEQTATENALIADGADTLTASLGGSGQFILYAPPLYLVKLLESWPEAFMEGAVFSGAYGSLTSQSSRRLSLARVVGYLNDIATLLTFQSPNVAQLRRTRLSVELLQRELTSDQP
ncbi:ATP-binding protein [Segeticoccus rhizosphaerae]|uniref:ATP-binding protein n=1 Tax=Segeticoccus rhizosphaerae TaxID=1104777 RepID=UPI0010C0F9FB|nr:ATP-binding protein [Ornithinicoccus soli]